MTRGPCTHRWGVIDRHENDDRIRTLERCEKCGAQQTGCYAKRLDDKGRAAWGRVGEWRHEPLGPAR